MSEEPLNREDDLQEDVRDTVNEKAALSPNSTYLARNIQIRYL
jgi:hypothetical protein